MYTKNQQQFMSSTINYLNDTKKLQPAIDIAFENIHYSVKVNVLDQEGDPTSKVPCLQEKTDKVILKGVSGILKGGQMTAIMGASGAGKTTLLNVLACRTQLQEQGKLYSNDKPYSSKEFGGFANYVMQHDLLMPTLTVRETFDFSASLKVESTTEERRARVQEIASRLKLTKALDTLVGDQTIKGISGGERKRTSIGFELITNPKVIMLDEPTSGLDSLTSFIIVNELKNLARNEGKTIAMTIHQPTSELYDLFDRLILMLDGKLVYQGKADKALNYFQKQLKFNCPEFMNPPDFFMSKIHPEQQQNRLMFDGYFNSYDTTQKSQIGKVIDARQTGTVVKRQESTGFINSVGALLKRDALHTLRSPLILQARVIQTLIMSVFVGGMYFDIGTRDYTNPNNFRSITGYLFLVCVNSFMLSFNTVSLTFPLERGVFLKEQGSKMYGVFAYYMAKTFVQLPYLVILPMISVLIMYWMVDLANTAEQFFIFSAAILMVSIAGNSAGLLVGSFFTDPKSVSIVAPVVILPVILFSGFFKNRNQLPVWIGWIEYISPIKYAFTIVTQNQMKNRASLIETLNFDVSLELSFILLAVLIVAIRFLSVFVLYINRTNLQ